MAMRGFCPYFVDHLPSSKVRPRPLPPELKPHVWKKFHKALKCGYMQFIHLAQVKSYVDYFQIPKGAEDIQMFLIGTSCGLNDTVFAAIFVYLVQQL